MREYMGILIAILLLCTITWLYSENLNSFDPGYIHEGFNPNHPDDRPSDYPDQSYSADLIMAEKQIQQMLETPSSKSPYLEDLLMLLQRI
jgi:hypothetical protein